MISKRSISPKRESPGENGRQNQEEQPVSKSIKTKVLVAACTMVAVYASLAGASNSNLQVADHAPAVFAGSCSNLFASECTRGSPKSTGYDAGESLRPIVGSDARSLAVAFPESSVSESAQTATRSPVGDVVSVKAGPHSKWTADVDRCISCDSSVRHLLRADGLRQPLEANWLMLPLILGVGTFAYLSSRKIV